jgi:hypothetical protein
MANVVDNAFKELLSRLQKEVLKSKGFKKSGNNFRIILLDGTSKIISFQRSTFNSSDECRFTINVGLYFQKDINNPDLRFKEFDCQVRTRVSGVSKRYQGDHWWVLTEVTNLEKLYAELLQLMKEDILPWLDQFETRRDVIRVGQTGALRGMIWGSVYVNI